MRGERAYKGDERRLISSREQDLTYNNFAENKAGVFTRT